MEAADAQRITRPGAPPGRPGGATAMERLERFGLLGLLVAVVLFFSFLPSTSDVFATQANFQVVVGNQSVLALAALATLVPLITNQYDLSIGAVVGLSSIVVGTALSDWGLGVVLACLLGVLAGTIIGAINALLVALLRVNSLIATLGMSTVILGLVQGYTSGESIVSGIPSSMTRFGAGNVGAIPNMLFVIAGAAAALWYVLVLTPFGRGLAAVGSNAESARLVGLSVQRLVASSFIIAGATAGAAGALQVARSGAANPTLGAGFTLPALAAVFLGATTIKPGRFNVLGTLIAIFFIAAVTSGLTLAGVANWVNNVVNGTALIVGVAMSTLIAHRRGAQDTGLKPAAAPV
jgi:ribose transport system permease protein